MKIKAERPLDESPIAVGSVRGDTATLTQALMGVLQRLLLGCCGPQSCHRHAVPFLEVSKFLTRFLTAVLKIYID